MPQPRRLRRRESGAGGAGVVSSRASFLWRYARFGQPFGAVHTGSSTSEKSDVVTPFFSDLNCVVPEFGGCVTPFLQFPMHLWSDGVSRIQATLVWHRK